MLKKILRNKQKQVVWDTKVKFESVSGKKLHLCPDQSFPAVPVKESATEAEPAGQKHNNSPEKTQTWRIHR